MSTWYVDVTNGSDASDGTTPGNGGGHGPVKTIAKAIGASGLAASGDTVYIAPGFYPEIVTVGITPTAETKIIGDVRRSKAWDATTPNGPIIWHGWTTNPYSAPSTSALCNINGKHHLTFQDIWWVGASNPQMVDALTTATSHDLTFRRCVFQARVTDAVFAFAYKGDASTDPALLFDCCIFVGGSSMLSVDAPLHATVNYTATVTVRNCTFLGMSATRGIEIQCSGAGTGHPQGPWTITHCTFLGNFSSGGIDPRNANWAAGSIKTYNNLALGTALQSGNNSTVYTSDYNRIIGNSSIGASTVGANDLGGGGTNAHLFPILLEWGQSALWGFAPRSYASIWPGAPGNAGFGESASAVDATDLLGRPRPAGAFVPGFESATQVTGTATSGTSTTVTKTGAGWTVNAFVGYVLSITAGTGSGQRRWVASNTATVLTVAQAFTTTPDATSVFSLDPPGLLKAPGAHEAHETGLPGGASAADGGAGNCLKLIGPADAELLVAVPASATVLSVKVKWDSAHGDGSKPRAVLLESPSIGVVASEDVTLGWVESKTATGTAGSGYETLTFSTFTPTAAGYVRLRLQSRAAAGNGIAYWDTIAVA